MLTVSSEHPLPAHRPEQAPLLLGSDRRCVWGCGWDSRTQGRFMLGEGSKKWRRMGRGWELHPGAAFRQLELCSGRSPPQGVSASSLRVCNQRQRPHERSLCLIHSLVFTRICSFIEHLYIPGAGRLLGQTGESHCMDNSRLASPRVQG